MLDAIPFSIREFVAADSGAQVIALSESSDAAGEVMFGGVAENRLARGCEEVFVVAEVAAGAQMLAETFLSELEEVVAVVAEPVRRLLST